MNRLPLPHGEANVTQTWGVVDFRVRQTCPPPARTVEKCPKRDGKFLDEANSPLGRITTLEVGLPLDFLR